MFTAFVNAEKAFDLVDRRYIFYLKLKLKGSYTEKPSVSNIPGDYCFSINGIYTDEKNH